jgi:hypothetical protein
MAIPQRGAQRASGPRLCRRAQLRELDHASQHFEILHTRARAKVDATGNKPGANSCSPGLSAFSVQAKTFAQTFAHLSQPDVTLGDLKRRNHAGFKVG